MEPQQSSIRSIGLKYGIIATIGFIIVFLISRALDLNDPTFRFVNYIILAIVIGIALNETRHIIHTHRISYLPGLGIGVWTTFTTALLYAIFMLLYCNVFNNNFIPEIREFLPFQDYINAGMLSFVAFGETLVAGVIATFVLMQLFKRNRNKQNEAAEELAEKRGVKDPNVQ